MLDRGQKALDLGWYLKSSRAEASGYVSSSDCLPGEQLVAQRLPQALTAEQGLRTRLKDRGSIDVTIAPRPYPF